MASVIPCPVPTPLRQLLQELREKRPARGRPAAARVPTGWAAIDGMFAGHAGREADSISPVPGGLPRGMMHEWFGLFEPSDPSTDPPSRTPRTPRAPWSPPLILLSHLAGRALQQQPTGWTVWIGGAAWPYPHTLLTGHRADRRLLHRSIWVDPPDAAARLWAIDEAIRCPAVTAVVADGSHFNMAATRRLQLAAASSAALLLITRPPSQLHQLSAAATRWSVTPVPSSDDQPRWSLRLLRCKGLQSTLTSTGSGAADTRTDPLTGAAHVPQWILQLDPAQGPVSLPAPLVDRPAATKAPPAWRIA